MENLYGKIGQTTPDNLIAGHEIPILTTGITLEKNQGTILRGTVLGTVTATGAAKLVDKSASDGTEKADCILTDNIDTGDGSEAENITAEAYITGVFNKNALIFGETDTAADHELRLRELGIYLKENIGWEE
ncbi:bacteriophage lambda head decoration protein D [Anaerobacterium chartisolvens]|uniref:Bacteriophage lambda head decoration protein D n=1 Tax=Anaerobacterium chartisolvens TaxID=1297424 RepID=A0A369BK91_9FIRM|nr:head decoration protein [Anaerobacterium chartisolvens]RCX20887.1 bacteriophage lambda head decoration protein D [Anaerobacterium chartisolvens]